MQQKEKETNSKTSKQGKSTLLVSCFLAGEIFDRASGTCMTCFLLVVTSSVIV